MSTHNAQIGKKSEQQYLSKSTRPPIFVISLERSPRSHVAIDGLRELGIPFEIVDAVDGAQLDANALGDLYDDESARLKYFRPLARSEIGVSLSHLAVCRTIVERGINHAIVLEEDVVVGPLFAAFWQELDTVPNGLDLVTLFTSGGFVRSRPSVSLGRFAIHRATTWLLNSVGYLVTLKCAEALLERTTRVDTVADEMFDHQETNQYFVAPMPIGHDGSGSSIEGERRSLYLKHRPLAHRCPKWIRALIYMSYAGFLFGPKYQGGLRAYHKREVAWRIKYLFAPGQINVKGMRSLQKKGDADPDEEV